MARGTVVSGARKIGGKQARARTGDSLVDYRKQATFALARQRDHELQIAARRRVDDHHRARRLACAGKSRRGSVPFCVSATYSTSAPQAADIRAREGAHRVKRRQLIIFLQTALGFLGVEQHRGLHGREPLPLLPEFLRNQLARKLVANHDLAGEQGAQARRAAARAACAQAETRRWKARATRAHIRLPALANAQR